MTYPDGRRYEGSFVSNKQHGYGTLTWADGSNYTGEWLENEMTGSVIYWFNEIS